ncbi:HBL239Cp [Eremothecium sinecaudum]|uniref:phosphoserine phosphatase n=1 Tax=Eremothecium sinecaudum TaxID=45286 RepID=A0A109UW45_9SACH|nr:HBL239Cp [Eremothecium sinecaudum]AMD18663.1 HBL239Cp [Eremothecium sinecaudum]
MVDSAKFVITAIAHGESLLPDFIDRFQNFLSSHEVLTVSKKELSQRATDYFVNFNSEADGVDQLKAISAAFQQDQAVTDVDIIVQKNDEHRRNKKLFIFDMDSTLIYQEVIELIAEYANVEKEVQHITNLAMEGKIDFVQSFLERVKLLRGTKADIVDEIKLKLQITEGAREFTKGLKVMGCKAAVVSGGFIQFANYLKEQLNLDWAHANTLSTEKNAEGEAVFSGGTEGEMVDADFKADKLLELAELLQIPVEATVMVGDGENDLPAMAVAGLSIAWHGKPNVRRRASCQLNTKSMADAFYILGLTDAEISRLIE